LWTILKKIFFQLRGGATNPPRGLKVK
jgi:hypothetical protein